MILMKVILRLVMIIIFIFTHALPLNEEKKRENIEKNKKVIHEYLLIHIELA